MKNKTYVIIGVSVAVVVACLAWVGASRYDSKRQEEAVRDAMNAFAKKNEIKKIVIDGHEAWGEVLLENPYGETIAYDFDAKLTRNGFASYTVNIAVPQLVADYNAKSAADAKKHDDEMRRLAVDHFIERSAKHDHKIDYLDIFERDDKVYVVGHASLQNGFGAWCKYLVTGTLKKGKFGIYEADLDLSER